MAATEDENEAKQLYLGLQRLGKNSGALVAAVKERFASDPEFVKNLTPSPELLELVRAAGNQEWVKALFALCTDGDNRAQLQTAFEMPDVDPQPAPQQQPAAAAPAPQAQPLHGCAVRYPEAGHVWSHDNVVMPRLDDTFNAERIMSNTLGTRGSANQLVAQGWKPEPPSGSLASSGPRTSKNVIWNDAELALQEQVRAEGKWLVIRYGDDLGPWVDGTDAGSISRQWDPQPRWAKGLQCTGTSGTPLALQCRVTAHSCAVTGLRPGTRPPHVAGGPRWTSSLRTRVLRRLCGMP